MKFIKKNFYSILSIVILFLIDRVSKYFIVYYFKTSENLIIPVTSFLKLNLIWNNGIAFGIMAFDNKFYYNILTFLIIIITIVLFYLIHKSNNIEKFGFTLVIGGSFGNIFDRIYFSSVIDFIDFHIGNFHWFIFNVADIFISLGVLILIINEFYGKKIIR